MTAAFNSAEKQNSLNGNHLHHPHHRSAEDMIREEDIVGSFDRQHKDGIPTDEKDSIEGKLREMDLVHREAKHDIASAKFHRNSALQTPTNKKEKETKINKKSKIQ